MDNGRGMECNGNSVQLQNHPVCCLIVFRATLLFLFFSQVPVCLGTNCKQLTMFNKYACRQKVIMHQCCPFCLL